MICINTLFFCLSLLCIYPIQAQYALNADDITTIGMQVWMNEASQRTDLLVFWSEHRTFPELGIGHCIWYPHGAEGPYTQQFPQLCNYLQDHGVQLPAWLEQAHHHGAPWKSREEFLNDVTRTEELRALLSATIDVQTNYMIDHLEQQWPLIVITCPADKRDHIMTCYNLLRSSAWGTYILVDYLNFRGDGLNPREECNGQRWGLLQVLIDMPEGLTQDNVRKAFTAVAAKTLIAFINNTAPHYNSIRYMHGWIKRLSTYLN